MLDYIGGSEHTGRIFGHLPSACHHLLHTCSWCTLHQYRLAVWGGVEGTTAGLTKAAAPSQGARGSTLPAARLLVPDLATPGLASTGAGGDAYAAGGEVATCAVECREDPFFRRSGEGKVLDHSQVPAGWSRLGGWLPARALLSLPKSFWAFVKRL